MLRAERLSDIGELQPHFKSKWSSRSDLPCLFFSQPHCGLITHGVFSCLKTSAAFFLSLGMRLCSVMTLYPLGCRHRDEMPPCPAVRWFTARPPQALESVRGAQGLPVQQRVCGGREPARLRAPTPASTPALALLGLDLFDFMGRSLLQTKVCIPVMHRVDPQRL